MDTKEEAEVGSSRQVFETKNAAEASNLPQLSVSITLIMAASAARKKEYAQAENLLLPLINQPEPQVDALDLMAKVYAQQGKIAEAKDLWKRALQYAPLNIHFRQALQDCEYINSEASDALLKILIPKLIIAFNIIFVIASIIIITIIQSISH